MKAELFIGIERFWRGSVLDIVNPVATLPLHADKELPGLFTIGSPFSLQLTNGNTVEVGCARTAMRRYVLEISHENQSSIYIAADAPISSQLRLPDGKVYEFSIRVEA